MLLPDDPFEQHEAEQTSAGLAHIVKNVAEFRDLCLDAGFTRGEAFKLARDMLNGIMDGVAFADVEGEE